MATRSTDTGAAIFPGAIDPRVIVHRDARWGWAVRWMQRIVVGVRLMAAEGASNASQRWPYTDPAALVVVVCLLAVQPVPSSGPLAWGNFVVQIIIMIVAMIVVVALTPKPPQPKPAELSDFDAPTAMEGKPIAKIFGEAWVKDPNVIWYGDLFSQPIRKKGGKK